MEPDCSIPRSSPTMVIVAILALHLILQIDDDGWISESNSGLKNTSTVDWLSSKIHAFGVHSKFLFFWWNENSRSLCHQWHHSRSNFNCLDCLFLNAGHLHEHQLITCGRDRDCHMTFIGKCPNYLYLRHTTVDLSLDFFPPVETLANVACTYDRPSYVEPIVMRLFYCSNFICDSMLNSQTLDTHPDQPSWNMKFAVQQPH